MDVGNGDSLREFQNYSRLTIKTQNLTEIYVQTCIQKDGVYIAVTPQLYAPMTWKQWDDFVSYVAAQRERILPPMGTTETTGQANSQGTPTAMMFSEFIDRSDDWGLFITSEFIVAGYDGHYTIIGRHSKEIVGNFEGVGQYTLQRATLDGSCPIKADETGEYYNAAY